MKDLIVHNKGKGIFDRNEWVKESKNLFVSAKLLRTKGRELKESLCSENVGSKSFVENLDVINSTNKSSRLLLGYAFELLLKSAILIRNYGAKKTTIDKIFRSYGHKMDQILSDLDIDLDQNEINILKLSSNDVVDFARYPVSAYEDAKYIDEYNKRIKSLDDDALFGSMELLYEKLKSIIIKKDRDSNNCAHFNTLKLDGVTLFMRFGGGVSARAIANYHDDFPDQDKSKLKLFELIKKQTKGNYVFFTIFWNEYDFFEDTGEKLKHLKDS
ncbi:hypothetical protein [Pantoea ananatis]|uniref:hypothetical protein n=1 Tax=Pantoea ananas TaxID=553 RepID=UPI002B1E14E3|nr:hypothetical protein [Pantoea ananatis]